MPYYIVCPVCAIIRFDFGDFIVSYYIMVI